MNLIRPRPRLLALALALLVVPAPVVAAPPAGGAASQAPGAAGFSINLIGSGDFVSQYTPYWCIGASMQAMLNIVGVTDDRTRAAQMSYQEAARANGTGRPPPGWEPPASDEAAGVIGGAGSGGWARALVRLGAGGYEERPIDGYEPALRTAALALRTTSRPVGLLVWRGAHAWVMSGFTATADPLTDPDFRVTGVYIQDPWYPRVSSIWGPGQEPNTLVSARALRAAFLPRRPGGWQPELAGFHVLVLPVSQPVHSAPSRGVQIL